MTTSTPNPGAAAAAANITTTNDTISNIWC